MAPEHLALVLLLAGAVDLPGVCAKRPPDDLGPACTPAALFPYPLDLRQRSFVNSNRNSFHIGNYIIRRPRRQTERDGL